MPPPTKRQKQAKQQRTSGLRSFHNGLVEDLLEITMDPDYQLDSQDANSDNEDSFAVGDMSFSLLDCNIEDELEQCSDKSDSVDIVCVGEKRKCSNDKGILEEFEAEDAPDYAEECAHKAVVSAHQFWADIMNSVSLKAINYIPSRINPTTLNVS